MGVSKHIKVCHFCMAEGIRFAHIRTDRPGDEAHNYPRHLCQQHYEVLDQAGERGRVNAGDGHRWWLSIHRSA